MAKAANANARKTSGRARTTTQTKTRAPMSPRGTNQIVRDFWTAIKAMPADKQMEAAIAASKKISEEIKAKKANARGGRSTRQATTQGTTRRSVSGTTRTTRKATTPRRSRQNTEIQPVMEMVNGSAQPPAH